MDYRIFGRTGVLVSPLCLGTMNFGGPTSAEDSAIIIQRALEAGINFIDTADVYNAGESERIVGQSLKKLGQRQQVFLTTKVNNRMGPGPNDAGASRFHLLKVARTLCVVCKPITSIFTSCIGRQLPTCFRKRPCARLKTWCAREKYYI